MIHPLTIGELKKFDEQHNNVEVVILPKVPAGDKIDIEYCYSGFLGQRVTIFLWHGKRLMGTIVENSKGELVLKAQEQPKTKIVENKASKIWSWLYRNIPNMFENL